LPNCTLAITHDPPTSRTQLRLRLKPSASGDGISEFDEQREAVERDGATRIPLIRDVRSFALLRQWNCQQHHPPPRGRDMRRGVRITRENPHMSYRRRDRHPRLSLHLRDERHNPCMAAHSPSGLFRLAPLEPPRSAIGTHGQVSTLSWMM